MNRTLLSLLLVLPLAWLTACEDNANNGDDAEFTDNWPARNATYFAERMAEAKDSIAKAQAQYGDDWESHCAWRVFPTYAKATATKQADSICVKVKENGTGAGYPYYTDSVKVNYIGRLIPTASYAEGRLFDHSGAYETEEAVFSPQFATPTAFAVSNMIEGYTTVLMHMRIGDRWQVFIPQELGYGSTSSGAVPAYSTLVFDMQLKAFYRKGEKATL